ncbi:MAG TPA: hypothetical protein DFL85_06210 [Lentisphaeria bacterium]|nr:hypothetical protein [Lentisphaeria bacterium]HCH85087.1 hypothetical protein [Lentisphaeria bacterium]
MAGTPAFFPFFFNTLLTTAFRFGIIILQDIRSTYNVQHITINIRYKRQEVHNNGNLKMITMCGKAEHGERIICTMFSRVEQNTQETKKQGKKKNEKEAQNA